MGSSSFLPGMLERVVQVRSRPPKIMQTHYVVTDEGFACFDFENQNVFLSPHFKAAAECWSYEIAVKMQDVVKQQFNLDSKILRLVD